MWAPGAAYGRPQYTSAFAIIVLQLFSSVHSPLARHARSCSSIGRMMCFMSPRLPTWKVRTQPSGRPLRALAAYDVPSTKPE